MWTNGPQNKGDQYWPSRMEYGEGDDNGKAEWGTEETARGLSEWYWGMFTC